MDTITTIHDLLKLNGSAQRVTVSLTPNESRLIAAAPNLLDSCQHLISVIEQLIPEPSARGVAELVLFQARAVIAEAEGR